MAQVLLTRYVAVNKRSREKRRGLYRLFVFVCSVALPECRRASLGLPQGFLLPASLVSWRATMTMELVLPWSGDYDPFFDRGFRQPL